MLSVSSSPSSSCFSTQSILLHLLLLSLLFVIINPPCPDLMLFPHLIISSFSITVLHPPLLYHPHHSSHHRNHYSPLLNHSSYIFFVSSPSPHLSSPPSTPGCIPCLHHPHHHPHHLPHSPHSAVFVCVGCTELYKSCMLMQQKAAEHYGEWTNFRSAWPHFITAHKPKVSCVR